MSKNWEERFDEEFKNGEYANGEYFYKFDGYASEIKSFIHSEIAARDAMIKELLLWRERFGDNSFDHSMDDDIWDRAEKMVSGSLKA